MDVSWAVFLERCRCDDDDQIAISLSDSIFEG